MLNIFYKILKTCLALWVTIGMGATAFAAPADHIVSREIFRDPTGQTGIETVGQRAFQPGSGIFAGGYSTGAIWLRLVVEPAKDAGPLILRVLPSYLNELVLYTADEQQPGKWKSMVSGNRFPWTERPHPAISLDFPIHPKVTTTYYLRLQTVSNALLNVEALSPDLAAAQELQTLLWQTLYMAIIVWIILWASQDYLMRKESVIVIFAMAYLFYLLYVIAILGYLPVVLPPGAHIPQIVSALVTLAVIFSLLFHRIFLALFDISTLGRWTLNLLLGCSLLNPVLMLFGQAQTALMLNSAVALVAGPCMFLAAITAKVERLRISIYYGLFMLSLAFYITPILGLTQGSKWTLHGALIQGLVTALLFSHLLYTRSKEWSKQKARAEAQLRLSNYQIEMQKEQLAQQGQFTAMLIHEIKNPLAAIRINLDSAANFPSKPRERITLALSEINALVDQCALSDRIEQGHLLGGISTIHLQQFLEDWLARRTVAARVRLVGDSDVPAVECSSQHLAIALGNLVDNALKYSPPDSNVVVAIASIASGAGEPGVRVLVSNLPGASGFPDAQLAFEKYYRGSRTGRQFGFGLGLYLVKTIAEQQGWRIHYTPTAEHVVFWLWIPLIAH